jgi:Na+(H+)/acetate symporter ActP
MASRISIERYSRYASGATVQILLFATLAIELKRRAPNAHTFLEVVQARYGKLTHFVYITFGLMTNILVTAMLLAGGSAVASSLTGVPTAAACFLLPVGVVLYTMFGGRSRSQPPLLVANAESPGIKATFLTGKIRPSQVRIMPYNLIQCSSWSSLY